jgi:hypothetical protein
MHGKMHTYAETTSHSSASALAASSHDIRAAASILSEQILKIRRH